MYLNKECQQTPTFSKNHHKLACFFPPTYTHNTKRGWRRIPLAPAISSNFHSIRFFASESLSFPSFLPLWLLLLLRSSYNQLSSYTTSLITSITLIAFVAFQIYEYPLGSIWGQFWVMVWCWTRGSDSTKSLLRNIFYAQTFLVRGYSIVLKVSTRNINSVFYFG